MARLVVCFFMLLAGLVGNAQLWNKTYIEDRPIMLFSSVVEDNGNYYITGVTFDNAGNGLNRALIIKLDAYGVLINYKTIYDSLPSEYAAFHNTLIIDSFGSFHLTGYSYAPQVQLFAAAFDSTLDSITVYNYFSPNTYFFAGMKMIQYNNCYYVTGVNTDNALNDANVVLVKIDSAGNRLFEKYYNSIKRNYAKSIIKLQNGNLMMGAYRSDNSDVNEHASTWLIEVDTGGTIQRQWFDPSDSTYAAEGLLQTPDGGFVYGAQKKSKQTVNDVYKVGSVIKLDSAFNKQWQFTDGSASQFTGIFDLELLTDGSLIGCGNKPFYNGDSSMLSGWIVKLSADGEVLWSKTYAGVIAQFSQNYLSDIDVLSDGSLIAVGQCQQPGHTPGQVGWFLKLDSNGCEIENCLVGLGPQTPEGGLNSQIQVWPNPFSSDVSIALTGSYTSTATFTISNITGQVVYHQQESNLATGYTKMLDLSYLPNGVYFVEVSTAAGKAVQRLVKE